MRTLHVPYHSSEVQVKTASCGLQDHQQQGVALMRQDSHDGPGTSTPHPAADDPAVHSWQCCCCCFLQQLHGMRSSSFTQQEVLSCSCAGGFVTPSLTHCRRSGTSENLRLRKPAQWAQTTSCRTSPTRASTMQCTMRVPAQCKAQCTGMVLNHPCAHASTVRAGGRVPAAVCLQHKGGIAELLAARAGAIAQLVQSTCPALLKPA
jgi:hypothetical protein